MSKVLSECKLLTKAWPCQTLHSLSLRGLAKKAFLRGPSTSVDGVSRKCPP